MIYKLFTVLLLTFLFAGCEEEKYDRIAMLTNIADTAILPAFSEFENESKSLSETIKNFQQNPSISTLEKAQKQWIRTADVWHQCETFKLGAYKDSYIPNRIYTSPTRVEYIDRILKSDDKINAKLIQSKGSNIVGLPAIEVLLFTENTEELLANSRKLEYLAALSEALKVRASKSVELWKKGGETYQQLITSQGTDLSSGISMLFNEIITVTEKIMISRVGKPFGKQSEGQADVKLLEAHLSGQSIQFIKTSLASVKNYFTGGESQGFDDYLDFLERKSSQKISDRIMTAFNKVEASAAKIKSLEKALTENKDLVENLYKDLKELLVLLKVDAANKLAITVTFNDNDGD